MQRPRSRVGRPANSRTPKLRHFLQHRVDRLQPQPPRRNQCNYIRLSTTAQPSGRQGSSSSNPTSIEWTQAPVGAELRIPHLRPSFPNPWSHSDETTTNVTPSRSSTRTSRHKSALGASRRQNRLRSSFRIPNYFVNCTHAARAPRRPGWRRKRLKSTATPAKGARGHHQVHHQVTNLAAAILIDTFSHSCLDRVI